MITETLTIYRGATDKYGEPNKQPHGAITGVLAWGTSGKSSAKFNLSNDKSGESAGVTAQLYVKRGADLKPRDRIQRTNGEQYAIVGHSLWDQASPMTGRDFGWMTFQIESTNS
ncbi:hypothetical protein [Mycobacterium avium]|uniref:hypothetical protein n=1 Tax=Mycobacterium avium TaxID=1764 RepID=UPI0003D208B1|nr:hypothetical protein [Mycobacterium avium]ETB13951.1 hypothetical protein P863_04325 [Mycobacterium avium subsp. silvaticum ATCC 49884]ETB20549.1 hypothetical protein O972_03425 [Mycobacterium avium subsp. avium 10-9275]ETB23589.1 hypothetical protein O973_03220 [Mycobacterium avium subsp. avium 11-4751]ANR90489.1 hypothetical protein BBJ32_03850 [Mycobacterium avium]AYJ03723.1 hypothetical protein DBO90_01980 [Mycobacterium avium]